MNLGGWAAGAPSAPKADRWWRNSQHSVGKDENGQLPPALVGRAPPRRGHFNWVLKRE